MHTEAVYIGKQRPRNNGITKHPLMILKKIPKPSSRLNFKPRGTELLRTQPAVDLRSRSEKILELAGELEKCMNGSLKTTFGKLCVWNTNPGGAKREAFAMTNSLRDLHVKNDDVMHSQRGGREDKAILSHYFSGTITLWSIASFINREAGKKAWWYLVGFTCSSQHSQSPWIPTRILNIFIASM